MNPLGRNDLEYQIDTERAFGADPGVIGDAVVVNNGDVSASVDTQTPSARTTRKRIERSRFTAGFARSYGGVSQISSTKRIRSEMLRFLASLVKSIDMAEIIAKQPL